MRYFHGAKVSIFILNLYWITSCVYVCILSPASRVAILLHVTTLRVLRSGSPRPIRVINSISSLSEEKYEIFIYIYDSNKGVQSKRTSTV